MSERESGDARLANTLRFLLIGLFLWLVRGILLPIVLGGIFALLISPLQGRLVRRLGPKRQKWSAMLLSLGLIVLVVLPVTFVIIGAINSIEDLMSRDWTARSE